MEKELDKEELNDIAHLRNVYQQLVFDMGEFYYEKLQILKDMDVKESFLKEAELSFQKDNDDLHQKLFDKYGKGKIDLTKGTITTQY